MSQVQKSEEDRIKEAILSTGFELEFYVQDVLRKKHWNVIGSRYYVDDVKGIEREIDVVAYKALAIQDIIYYTVLIISCKKSAESIWTFLTHDKIDDINFDYFPVSIVSSDIRMKHIIANERSIIIESLKTNQIISNLYDSNHKVFAYLQINSKSYRAEDSPKIYDSIITSIKAMEAEQDARKNQKRDGKPTFYNFNLISVYDGSFKEIFYHNNSNSICHIDEIKYINRHIINKVECFYRVHFVNKPAFQNVISSYDALFEENCKVYPLLIDEFYKSIWQYPMRVALYWEAFKKELDNKLFWICQYDYKVEGYIRKSDISYDYENGVLKLHVNGYYDEKDIDVITFLKETKTIKDTMGRLLYKYYRYQGDFTFDNDYLPF